MAERHYHIWYFRRGDNGTISSMLRHGDTYETRGRANYALRSANFATAGMVIRCDDYAFCRPLPDVSVKGFSVGGPVERTLQDLIDSPLSPSRDKSISPVRRQANVMKWLRDYDRRPDSPT